MNSGSITAVGRKLATAGAPPRLQASWIPSRPGKRPLANPPLMSGAIALECTYLAATNR